MYRLTLILLVYLSSDTAFGAGLDDSGWLALGDIRGHIEPCGCNPESDLGGVRRMGTLLQRERALNPNLYLFSTGNNLTSHPEVAGKSSQFILEALTALKPTAILFNQTERQAHALIPKFERHLRFVLSNARRKIKGVDRIVRSRHAYVFGYVNNKAARKEIVTVDARLIKRWRRLLQKKKASDFAVLLFSGPKRDLQKFERASLFSLIISANTRSLKKEVDPAERFNPALLARTSRTRMVPVGGQGVLRGGRLMKSRAKSVSELLAGECKADLTGKCQTGKGGGLLAPTYPVTWLDKSFEVGHPFSDLFARYNKASADAFAVREKRRVADLKASPFAGSQACRSCHAKEYEIWAKSGHAKAHATLKAIGKHKDAVCVSCHVLGFDEKGGFVSEKHSPQFMNVNCENCHGPRLAHTQQPTKFPEAKVDATKVCVSCHHGTHTPDFNYDLYWSKIKHGQR